MVRLSSCYAARKLSFSETAPNAIRSAKSPRRIPQSSSVASASSRVTSRSAAIAAWPIGCSGAGRPTGAAWRDSPRRATCASNLVYRRVKATPAKRATPLIAGRVIGYLRIKWKRLRSRPSCTLVGEGIRKPWTACRELYFGRPRSRRAVEKARRDARQQGRERASRGSRTDARRARVRMRPRRPSVRWV